MALTYTPLSELDAVNAMLEVIGQQPVNTLETSGVTDATIARGILHNTSRAVQGLGLHCNTEYNYTLSPDVDGYVQLPSNTLKVDPSDRTQDYVLRGAKLYNLKDHTFVFTEDVDVDITFFLAFTDLSQPARDYITIRSARRFARRVLGSDTLDTLTAEEEQQAKATLMAEDADVGDYSIFDNYSVARVVQRWNNPVGVV